MISTVLFDMNDVLCGYDREVRIAHLARASGKPPASVEAAIWGSGYQDLGYSGAMDAEGYLRGFAERLGGGLTLGAWTAALRAALTPLPKALELAAAVRRRTSVAVLTNNNLLAKHEIDAIFPELRPIFGSNIFVSADSAPVSPIRRSIAAVSPGLARRRRGRCLSTTARGTWPAPSAPASAAFSMPTPTRWPSG